MQSQFASFLTESPPKSICLGPFFRYLVVAALALAADAGALSALVRIANFPLVFAAVVAFFVGATVNYCLSVAFVFHQRKLENHKGCEFALFFTIGIFGLAITQGVLYLGVTCLGFNLETTKIAAAGLTFIFNFGVRKTVLFS